MTIPKLTDILIGLAIVFGVGGAALRDEKTLAVSLLCILTIIVEPQLERFHANRDREQRKPEKYHFTS